MDETINDIIGEQNDFDILIVDQKSTTSTESTKGELMRSNEDLKCSNNSVENSNEKTSGMEAFLAKLEKIVKSLKNHQEIKKIDKYSVELKKKLDREIEELDFTMTETKATIQNIQRLKKQRYYIKKELRVMTKNLTKAKQEELKEMELVVAVYDKDLLRKWHLIKKTNSPHSLEGFINNVIGKRQAVDNIYKMAKDKLEVLKKNGATSSLPALADKVLIETEMLSECDDSFSET